MTIISGVDAPSQINKKEYLNRNDFLTLYQGDSTDANLFKEEFIDLIVTSPPYNVGIEYNSNDDTLGYDKYLQFTEKWI
jgi:site-specific DNA-methyltransferase (adenine-specific)